MIDLTLEAARIIVATALETARARGLKPLAVVVYDSRASLKCVQVEDGASLRRPDIALGVVRYLAARQGVKHDPETLEQPGKILHEERTGELTRLGLTVFQPYYGSADATPRRRALGATNRSSSHTPLRPRKVENVQK